MGEDAVGMIREKIPTSAVVEKKNERHLADFRDKRNKSKRHLGQLVEDAERKKVLHEEAAKVTAQKEEVDEIDRQIEVARAQVQLRSTLPSLPSDGGDMDHGFDASRDEAMREAQTILNRC